MTAKPSAASAAPDRETAGVELEAIQGRAIHRRMDGERYSVLLSDTDYDALITLAAAPVTGDRETAGVERVHIETNAYLWRPGSCGYTRDPKEAGVWTREEAERIIAGCGPEKHARLIPATPPSGGGDHAGVAGNGGLGDDG